MAIVFNGLELNGSLQWTDRHSYSPVAQEVLTTLGGNPVVYSAPLQKGQPITLVAREDTGWLTHAMITSLEAMATVPGAIYTLDFHGAVYSVVFAHHDGPAMDFQPMVPRAQPQPDDPYTGTMKLMTV